MKRAEVAAPGTFAPFQKGQIWRLGDINLAVTSVGKTLVHYKRYKAQARGAKVELSSKADLQKHLLANHAVLVTG
jgi:hypothetical protein